MLLTKFVPHILIPAHEVTATNRGVGLDQNVVLVANIYNSLIHTVGVVLNLVDGRNDLAPRIPDESLNVIRAKVGNPEMPDLALLVTDLESLPDPDPYFRKLRSCIWNVVEVLIVSIMEVIKQLHW